MKTLLILYHSSNLTDGNLAARDLLTKKVRKLLAPGALDVLLHLETHQGYTIPELVKNLGMSWQTSGRVHRSLLDLGLVQKVAKVERRYLARRHRPVPIFLLKGAPPEAAHETMRRYAELPREGRVRERHTQATIDEAIAAIKLVTPDLKGNLKDHMPALMKRGIKYQVARVAVQQLNNHEDGEIWV